MSSFYIIEPITITDTILTACNVAENDEQEWTATDAYVVGDEVQVTTSTANIHKTYECLEAQSAGIDADLLDEDCSGISDWTDADTGVGGGSSIRYPDGQFCFNSLVSAAGNYHAMRHRTIASPPNLHTIEIKLYHTRLGAVANNDHFSIQYQGATWIFLARFASDGLFIIKTGGAVTEVGTNLVKQDTNAAWQTWRFEINKTTESAATVEVFLKEENGSFASQGTYDCDYETTGTDGLVALTQFGYGTDYRKTNVDYIYIGTGNDQFDYTNESPVGNTKWLEVDSTNRWKAFNNVLGSQTSQATKIEYVLTPSEVIDSIALMNIESDTVDIVEIDNDDNLILNGLNWTDATGTTQPTSWDKVGTCSDFTIDSGMIRLTADANGEGISQTITVSAATEYQLLGIYKNTADDLCQYAIYDVTHSADIVAATDLTSSTVNSSFSKVFNTPAGCTSIKISLLCKTSGDIVWFDHIKCAPTEYSETVTTGATVTDAVKLDIPEKANGILTVTINKSGTAAIGELIIGNKTLVGKTQANPSPEIEIVDYSSQVQDTFGNWTITERGYSKKLNCDVKIEKTDTLTAKQNTDEMYRVLSSYRASMIVWIADLTMSSMIIYGKYNNFKIILSSVNFSMMSIEILGMI